MKLVVGLGNPGKKYENNRHNVGMRVVDAMASSITNGQWRIANRLEAEVFSAEELLLAKPRTFMNDSGRAVKKLVDFYKLDTKDLYIVHDDLDIALGSFKIQKGKEPRQHNGVESVNESLGTKDYWHVRVGIDNRKVEKGRESREGRKRGEEYVLEDFAENEERTLKEVLGKIEEDLHVRL